MIFFVKNSHKQFKGGRRNIYLHLHLSDLLMHFLQKGGKKYNTEMSGEWTPIWYHHDDRGSKVFEKFCKYKINGIDGYGLVEFHYRLVYFKQL